ncbi:hypothetical protein AMATHDRAFT_2286 [Amanita thiersii Skay4041]|uniref:non-specific serine/threonine protein kinase n=1 Tax=Amanita thiersii Skay4041 TaxID=703135 RepID=A0A2A9NX20_9AGAR|nr:hypothetical protein AMATHDRAFT_2286 [Amanita thiersii Skay4041]
MAANLSYSPFNYGKGTLVPGQTIVVNKHSVQVERYLSQGGFSHVYLVRTATPVYNTTHHVLKRIAVSDQPMLAEVKKEVDIMRLLKGHPNIVHFIDAAWHKMSNGAYEVFILMEYCPGGGIIDMMNRRLRERLTEADILKIFVDVCEAVAFMHNLRPPLLHRDLKVENILQSSTTSYKLCDFGSAATLSKPPSNMQELRAMEADLNKHTTIQYRAPEMIDLHMRRAVDEKSDVWALGVLLYKLCYYTTPFEEHGKMLKDHGTMRPSVFEILAEVHHMRGTKSQFYYNIAPSQPFSPSHVAHGKNPTLNALDGVITYRSSKPASTDTPVKNQGVQARDKVLDAIAPMRRGRPTPAKEPASNSRPSSPQKQPSKFGFTGLKPKAPAAEIDLTQDENIWKPSAMGVKQPTKVPTSFDDNAWRVSSDKENLRLSEVQMGFNDNFTDKIPLSVDISSPSPRPTERSDVNMPIRSAPHKSTGVLLRKIPLSHAERDAFDDLGLGLSTKKPEPTLGEARKLRTGLATLSSNKTHRMIPNAQPISSPQSSHLLPPTQLQAQGFLSASASNASSTGGSYMTPPQVVSRPGSSMKSDGIPIESRFPSLEDLDATFSSSPKPRAGLSPSIPAAVGDQGSTILKPQTILGGTTEKRDDLRSAYPLNQTTLEKQGSSHTRVFELKNNAGDGNRLENSKALPSSLMRATPRRGASLSIKPTPTRRNNDTDSLKHISPSDDLAAPREPKISHASSSSRVTVQSQSRSLPSPSPAPKSSPDWLTGDETVSLSPLSASHTTPAEVPILRQSPSKRASIIEKSDVPFQNAVVAHHEHALISALVHGDSLGAIDISPTITRFSNQFPSLDDAGTDRHVTYLWDTAAGKENDISSSSADEGPEDVNGSIETGNPRSFGRKSRRGPRQSSVHDLVDLWGGGIQLSKGKELEIETGTSRDLQQMSKLSLSPPSAKLSILPRADSQERTSASYAELTPAKLPFPSGESHEKEEAAMIPVSPVARGRSRPQSLFLLSPKTPDTSAQLSASLEPPADVKRRTSIRRSSITDMVHHYEAIGGNSRSMGIGPGPPSPLSAKKSTGSKIMAQSVDYGRAFVKPGDNKVPAFIPSSQSTITPENKDINHRSSPTRIQKTNTGALSSPSADRQVFPSRTSESSDSSIVKTPDSNLTRPRRISLKPMESPKPPVSLQERLAADEKRERPSQVTENCSSSPERPFQGVGKLIDQWQRKAEASEPVRTPVGIKRSSIVSKRPGVAAAGKGQ